MIHLVHDRSLLAGSPGKVLDSSEVSGLVLSRGTDKSNHSVTVVSLGNLTGLPLKELPSRYELVTGTAVKNYGSTYTCKRAVIDVILTVSAGSDRAGQRAEFPKTLDLGSVYGESIVNTRVTADNDRHLTGSETVGRIVRNGERIVTVKSAGEVEGLECDIGIEIDSRACIHRIVKSFIGVLPHATAGLIDHEIKSVDVGYADRHIISLKNRKNGEELMPCFGNLKAEVCKDVHTVEHHSKRHCLRNTVGNIKKRYGVHCRICKSGTELFGI